MESCYNQGYDQGFEDGIRGGSLLDWHLENGNYSADWAEGYNNGNRDGFNTRYGR